MISASIGEITPLLPSRNAGTHQGRKKCQCSVIAAAVVVFAVVASLLTSNGRFKPIPTTGIESYGDPNSSVFHHDFIWGVSTSAYQIEGGATASGRGPSIWDTWCAQAPLNCNGEDAHTTDDHFHHWQEDIDLMSTMGIKAYRFSISWSRILPNGTSK